MKYCIIFIFASILSSINSSSIGPLVDDEEALRVRWSPGIKVVRQIGINGISDSTEIPNNLEDLKRGESSNEVFINSANNYNRNDQSDGLILSESKENLENLFTDFMIDYEQQAVMQWLGRLELTIDQILSENSSVSKLKKNLDGLDYIVEGTAPSQEILRTVKNFKDLVDSADDLNIYYQEGQAERYENFPASVPLIRDKFSSLNYPDFKIDEKPTKNNKKSTNKELNVILSDLLQGEVVNRMRNYLETDCSKHNHEATSSKIDIPVK